MSEIDTIKIIPELKMVTKKNEIAIYKLKSKFQNLSKERPSFHRLG